MPLPGTYWVIKNSSGRQDCSLPNSRLLVGLSTIHKVILRSNIFMPFASFLPWKALYHISWKKSKFPWILIFHWSNSGSDSPPASSTQRRSTKASSCHVVKLYSTSFLFFMPLISETEDGRSREIRQSSIRSRRGEKNHALRENRITSISSSRLSVE